MLMLASMLTWRRYSSLEVLFDTLKYHGAAFTIEFWTRIFDSVLLPIFDHVRAEVRAIAAVLQQAGWRVRRRL